jgi:glutaredoxin/glutathione-dependent peroxiredoxin
MPIAEGQSIPSATLRKMTEEGIVEVSTTDYCKGRKVIIFGLPGAFTPTCSRTHVPSFVKHYDELQQKGVSAIACVSVNDAFVMDAWGQTLGAAGKVDMLADGSADFAKALDLTLDLSAKGMGLRMNRFLLIVDDGVVTNVKIEESAGCAVVSTAQSALALL